MDTQMAMKKVDKSLDVSVLLIFFVRHAQFKRVFEQVRKARPARLFLYQDGPRQGHSSDAENIRKCREIAENVDWDCEVHTFYQEKNQGVDPSGYLADSWAFSLTDKCIVLEDDCLPSLSFFYFAKEMLDRYEKDRRVMLISGFNVEGITRDVQGDYFFSSTTFTWGWASWSRVVKHWDPAYTFLSDRKKRRRMERYITSKHLVGNMLSIFENHRDSGVEHFETILISGQYLREGLTIVPVRNQVQNIGIAEGSSHFASELSMLPRGLRRLFTTPACNIGRGPFRPPEGGRIDHEPYRKRAYRIYGWGHPLVKVFRLAESMVYACRAGKWRVALSQFQDRLKKLLKRTSA